MSKLYDTLTPEDILFIQDQKLFYIASSSGQEVNLSPKGYESLYIQDPQTLYFLDYPGSGNRTARDVTNEGEVTLLFNAFEGSPQILRLFCKGELIEKSDSDFSDLYSHFKVPRSIIRQLMIFKIYKVEQSCGMSVPYMHYEKERDQLKDWAIDMAEDGELRHYIVAHRTPPLLK